MSKIQVEFKILKMLLFLSLKRPVSVYNTRMFLGGYAACLGTPSMTKRCTVASNPNWTTGSSDRRRPMVGRLIGAHLHTESKRREENRVAVIARRLETARFDERHFSYARFDRRAFLFLS